MPSRFSVATWNINSVRLRLPLVERFLTEQQPDVLCLQEIKCLNDQFPSAALRKLGYQHIAINGQRGYHGVATVSRLPFTEVATRGFCDKGDCRHVMVGVEAGGRVLNLHNFYVPAGGDVPDPEVNPKFAHKLAFLEEMRGWLPGAGIPPAIIVGDLNIAPYETDVWSHRQLLNVVSHTPVETAGLEAVRQTGGWTDVMRHLIPPEERLYTWWSYRAKDWRASDRGRRLDHVWAHPDLAAAAERCIVFKDARDWPPASDHVPVMVEFAFD